MWSPPNDPINVAGYEAAMKVFQSPLYVRFMGSASIVLILEINLKIEI